VINELLERYAAAWAAGDRAAWLATFAPDATQEDPVGRGVRRGHEEIGGFWDDAMRDYRSVAILPRQIFVSASEAAMVWRIAAELEEGWRVFDGVDAFTVDDTPLITGVRAYWESEARRVVRRDEVIFHLAIRANWDAATATYRMSTIERTLDEEGFIHCSFADQVEGIATRYYADLDELVLLTVDPTLLTSELVVEDPFPGAPQRYPHVYTPIPVAAVVATTAWRRQPDEPWVSPV